MDHFPYQHDDDGIEVRGLLNHSLTKILYSTRHQCLTTYYT